MIIRKDASCLSSAVSVLLWLLEARTGDVASMGAATGSSAAVDDGLRAAKKVDCDGDDGVAGAVKLLRGVVERCMKSSKGRQLLGKHLGHVVEHLVGS